MSLCWIVWGDREGYKVGLGGAAAAPVSMIIIAYTSILGMPPVYYWRPISSDGIGSQRSHLGEGACKRLVALTTIRVSEYNGPCVNIDGQGKSIGHLRI
jgi:hypothetical protein